MQPTIFWISEVRAGWLAIMPRPRGGDWLEDEIRSLRTMGVDTVVSLLECEEVQELDIEGEKAFCEAIGISFLSFPIPDRNIPGIIKRGLEICRIDRAAACFWTARCYSLPRGHWPLIDHCRLCSHHQRYIFRRGLPED